MLASVSFLPQNVEKRNVTTEPTEAVTTTMTTSEPVTTETTTAAATTEPTATATTTEITTTVTTTESTTAEDLVEVPDFSGYTYKQLKKDKDINKNFEIVYEFNYSDTVEKDGVIGQRAAAGSMLKKGSQVNVIISLGAEEILLRDVTGMDYDTACELLSFAGFKVSAKVEANDGTQTPNQVFSMSEKPNQKYKKGTEVVLSIWGK